MQKRAEREAEAEKQKLTKQRGFGDFQKQMTATKNDMSVSSAEADQREYQLKRQYYTSSARWLYHDKDDDVFGDDEKDNLSKMFATTTFVLNS
ncbi:unnamed protein product [Strongylus vulgaris]|uniref:Uncharacterized protein n=1 Tax=Strongylus vulgaris TaxID=40348 RepID=A0A3P7JXP6_STRVU|nr:unnamed protein product [Strongylus vulgaris]